MTLPFGFSFRYEGISEFCHICGLITHATIQCHARDAAYIEMNDGHQFRLYGNWLKVNLRLIAHAADFINKQYKDTAKKSQSVRIEARSGSTHHFACFPKSADCWRSIRKRK